jgi:cytochrome c peroxidase
MHIHWHIWEPRLADHELDLLVAFLMTLTDETFAPPIPERVPSGLEPVGVSPIDNNTPATVASQRAEARGASS